MKPGGGIFLTFHILFDHFLNLIFNYLNDLKGEICVGQVHVDY